MRVISLLVWTPLALAFAPNAKLQRVKTEVAMDRRTALSKAAVLAGIVASPQLGNAFSQQSDDNWVEPSQQKTDGRLDLNNTPIGEYKYLVGMYPTAAGKIASHGPYGSVSDIYKIEGLTANDKKLFKKYEKYFTVNAPGRTFNERINGRVST